MDFRLDGYCGLYCGACPVMLETRAACRALLDLWDQGLCPVWTDGCELSS